jgi:hypothetical protein
LHSARPSTPFHRCIQRQRRRRFPRDRERMHFVPCIRPGCTHCSCSCSSPYTTGPAAAVAVVCAVANVRCGRCSGGDADAGTSRRAGIVGREGTLKKRSYRAHRDERITPTHAHALLHTTA